MLGTTTKNMRERGLRICNQAILTIENKEKTYRRYFEEKSEEATD